MKFTNNQINQVLSEEGWGWQIQEHDDGLLKISYVNEKGETDETNYIEGIWLDAAKELAKIILEMKPEKQDE